MHDDLVVVQKDPAALSLPLPAQRLRAELGQGLLDRIHHGPHRTVVGRGAQQEHVGEHEVVAHIDGDDVISELGGGGMGGRDRKGHGMGIGSHTPEPTFPRWLVPAPRSARRAQAPKSAPSTTTTSATF